MIPSDTNSRLDRSAALTHDAILHSEPEAAFDRLTRLAARSFQAPIATIVLTVDDGYKCKSAFGLESREHLATSGLYDDAIEHGELRIIPDASGDRRLQSHPLVAAPPHVRFCASAPLITPDGHSLGALNIADVQPRSSFSNDDADQLRDFAALIVGELERRQERSQRQEAKDANSAMFAAMSHDLRTPLNGVIGMAELLLAADDLGHRHMRRVEIIKRSGRNLLSMLDNLIELSKLDIKEASLDASPVDLQKLLSDVDQELQSDDLGKSFLFGPIDGLGADRGIIGDASRLRKLLRTFASVAARFTASEALRITAAAGSATSKSVQIRFDIVDAQMDADAIERLSEVVGLGARPSADSLNDASLELILCKKLALIMGGAIGIDRRSPGQPVFRLDIAFEKLTVEGQSEVGSTVMASDRSTAQSAESSCVDDRTMRDVLVAEDNPDMALLIEDFLEDAGYRAIVVPDGASVMKVLGEQRVDVVLMDGRMPDMTGFETTELIRRLPDERANVPIIALTADALAGDRERYLSAGMDDYVAKPVDYEMLTAAIERCCRDERRGAA